MVSTHQVNIKVIQNYNQKELTFTITKLQVADMFQEPSQLIQNQVQWIQSELVHSVNYSDQITLSSVNQVLVTAGLRVTTLKVLNQLMLFQMLLERKLNHVIAYKVSNQFTHQVVVLVQVWVPYYLQNSVKNIQIVSQLPSQLFHHQRFQIQLLNHTMLHYQLTNQLNQPMKFSALITKLFMIFASEHLSLHAQHMVILTTQFHQLCQVSQHA